MGTVTFYQEPQRGYHSQKLSNPQSGAHAVAQGTGPHAEPGAISLHQHPHPNIPQLNTCAPTLRSIRNTRERKTRTIYHSYSNFIRHIITLYLPYEIQHRRRRTTSPT